MDIVTEEKKRPWKRAALWLLFLGPFFFITYGFANNYAASQTIVRAIVFDWEQHIPFVAWTILPYWSIDLLYGISLFMCINQRELDTHAKRLLTAQIIAVSCFILFPLTFTFVRPETSGMFGFLFDTLSAFDKPYNQAPSLHITLMVILWVLYAKNLPSILIWPCHLLFFSIGISVLTTYQHHFIDIPTGVLLGWLCIWLWPDEGESPFKLRTRTASEKQRRIAFYYFFSATVFAFLAMVLGGGWLWLLWPAVSLLLVALNYAWFGVKGFQKYKEGCISQASRWLLWPYLLGARINAYLWTRDQIRQNHVVDGVSLGCFPSRQALEKHNYKSVIDLTAEFQRIPHSVAWYGQPCLDLLPLHEQDLVLAAKKVEQAVAHGPVLVCCALGYSRSALVIIYWLVITERAPDVSTAVELVRRARPVIVIKGRALSQLREIIEKNGNE